MKEKIEAFANLLETEKVNRLILDGWLKERAMAYHKVKVIPGKKYTKVDIGTSGRYMVENATGNIFGVKGYGVIHRGHFYGTVDTINDYDWSDYYPVRKDGTLKLQKGNGCPVITKAPESLVTPDTVKEYLSQPVTAKDLMG
jgi:hypothetical protein